MPDPDDRMTTWPEAGSPGTIRCWRPWPGCRRGKRYRRLPEPYARVRRAFPRGRRLAAGSGWPRNTAHGGASGRYRVRRQPLYYRYQLPARDPGRGETSARRNRGPACRRGRKLSALTGTPGRAARPPARHSTLALISRLALRLARPLTLPGQPSKKRNRARRSSSEAVTMTLVPYQTARSKGRRGDGQPGKPAVAWAGQTSRPSRSRQHIQFGRCRCCGHRLRRVPGHRPGDPRHLAWSPEVSRRATASWAPDGAAAHSRPLCMPRQQSPEGIVRS